MNEMIFVSGQRGSGKSYWVKDHLRGLTRYLLYDTMGEYGPAAGPCFVEIDELIDYLVPYENGGGFFEAVFAPIEDSDFETFCEVGLALGNVCVIIEEVDQFATPYYTPLAFQKMIKRGRHRGVNVLGVSQRPASVSRLLTSQTTRFIVFRMFEPKDITYYKSIIGPVADRLGKIDNYDFFDIDFNQGGVQVPPQTSRLP